MEQYEDHQKEKHPFPGQKGTITVTNLIPSLPDSVRSERQKTIAGELFLVFSQYLPVQHNRP